MLRQLPSDDHSTRHPPPALRHQRLQPPQCTQHFSTTLRRLQRRQLRRPLRRRVLSRQISRQLLRHLQRLRQRLLRRQLLRLPRHPPLTLRRQRIVGNTRTGSRVANRRLQQRLKHRQLQRLPHHPPPALRRQRLQPPQCAQHFSTALRRLQHRQLRRPLRLRGLRRQINRRLLRQLQRLLQRLWRRQLQRLPRHPPPTLRRQRPTDNNHADSRAANRHRPRPWQQRTCLVRTSVSQSTYAPARRGGSGKPRKWCRSGASRTICGANFIRCCKTRALPARIQGCSPPSILQRPSTSTSRRRAPCQPRWTGGHLPR